MAVPDRRSGPGMRHRSDLTWLRSRSMRTYLVITALTVVSIVLVLLSPLGLELLNRTRGVDWAQLSNIGQTYGAISAVLTVFAVGGVALSLILQVREARAARAQIWRTFHQDLLQRAMDDPLYLSCWGVFPAAPSAERRQNLYVNLMVSFWQMLYEIGNLDEQALRRYASSNLFPSEAGRRFWGTVRSGRAQGEVSRQYLRFHQIIDDEYGKAVAAGPPLVPADLAHEGHSLSRAEHHPASDHSGGSRSTTAALLGLAGGLLLRDSLRRILRRHTPPQDRL